MTCLISFKNISQNMSNIDLSKLKSNKKIKYIYVIPNSFYECKQQYIFVGDLDTEYEDNIFCYSMEDWFDLMANGNLLPYACSILSKKYRKKEYLNVYQKPDMLLFRKYILNSNLSDMEQMQQLNWAIQILNEFKINRHDVFLEKQNMDYLLSDFLNKIDGQYKMQIEKELC